MALVPPSDPLTVAPVSEARGYVQVYPSPKRAALYVRVSTALQELDGTSLSTQETACRVKLAEWGIAPHRRAAVARDPYRRGFVGTS